MKKSQASAKKNTKQSSDDRSSEIEKLKTYMPKFSRSNKNKASEEVIDVSPDIRKSPRIAKGGKNNTSMNKEEVEERELLQDLGFDSDSDEDIDIEIDVNDLLTDFEFRDFNLVNQKNLKDMKYAQKMKDECLGSSKWELVELMCYEPRHKVWITQLHKRDVGIQKPPNFEIPGGESSIQLWDVKYSTTSGFKFRNPKQKFKFPVDGLFEFCACDNVDCQQNVATSPHYCGFCLHRMNDYCIEQPNVNTFGICRSYFIEKKGYIW